MMSTKQLEDAIKLAVSGHYGQTDLAGAPYILHLIRVMDGVETPEEKICAILHDLVEDTAYTFDDLVKLGYSDTIIEALKCLTKSDNECYIDYIRKVKTNSLATRVKLSDLTDNLNLKRLKSISVNDIPRINKYLNAYHFLSE